MPFEPFHDCASVLGDPAAVRIWMVQHQKCAFEQWHELIHSRTSSLCDLGVTLLCSNLCCVLQYTIVYQCIVAIANHTAFFQDGSMLSLRQVCCYAPCQLALAQSCCQKIVLLLCHQVLVCPVYDFACWLAGLTPSLPRRPPTHTTQLVHHVQGQFLEIEAAMVAFAACWVHPLPSLNRHKPQQRISDGYGLALLASMACCLQLAQMLMMALLCTSPWFQGGLGISSWVSICTSWCMTDLATALWCIACRGAFTCLVSEHARCSACLR